MTVCAGTIEECRSFDNEHRFQGQPVPGHPIAQEVLDHVPTVTVQIEEDSPVRPVYVRARDASFYRNPLVAFAEGFLCFDEKEQPELVLWLDEHHLLQGQAIAPPVVLAIVAKRFGVEHGVSRVSTARIAERVVPGTEPHLFQPAAAFHVDIQRRIPQPKFHEGAERRTSRVGDCFVIDLPAHSNDAHELAVSESP